MAFIFDLCGPFDKFPYLLTMLYLSSLYFQANCIDSTAEPEAVFDNTVVSGLSIFSG